MVITHNLYGERREDLDSCLTLLEDAIERGEAFVDPETFSRIHPVVPRVTDGLPISRAVELIFVAQEELFAGQRAEMSPRHVPSADELPQPENSNQEGLCEAEARELTRKIRYALDELPLLLKEAHDRRVWPVLGYRSWEEYVRMEFSLSRSRSYELVEQARVIEALKHAVGGRNIPPVSGLAALQLKPVLAEVVAALKEQVRTLTDDEFAQLGPSAIRQVIRDARARSRDRRTGSTSVVTATAASSVRVREGRIHVIPSESEPQTTASFTALCDAIAFLAEQPPPSTLLESLSESHLHLLGLLPIAHRWLGDLLIECEARWQRLPAPQVRAISG